MNKKLSLIGNIAIAGFFLLFPVTGLLLIWNDAHSKIQNSAINYVGQTLPDLTKSLENKTDNEDISLALKDQIKKSHPKIIAVSEPTEIKPLRSWTKEENDRMAQYVSLDVTAPTQTGPIQYRVIVRRLTIAPRWRYTEIQQLP